MWPSGPFYILSEVESSPASSDNDCPNDDDGCKTTASDRKLLIARKESSYQKRLRTWEARERRMARKYAKRKEQEDEQLLQQVKTARTTKAFLETYDDRVDDPAFYNTVTMLRKLQDRVREQSLDDQDRLNERKELEELRARLEEDCSALPRNRRPVDGSQRRKPWCSATKIPESRSPPPEDVLAKIENVRAWQAAADSVTQARADSTTLVPVGSRNGRAAPTPAQGTKEAVFSTSPSWGDSGSTPLLTAVPSVNVHGASSDRHQHEEPPSVPYSPTMPADPRRRAPRPSKVSSNASIGSSQSSSRKSATKVKVRVVAEPSVSGESISSGEVDLVVFGARRNGDSNAAERHRVGAKASDVCHGKDEMQRLLNESSLTVSSPEDGEANGEDRAKKAAGAGDAPTEPDLRETNAKHERGRTGGGSSFRGVNGMSHHEKLRYIESLIPARREALFRYRVDPRLMDKDMVKKHILPWVHRKMAEFTGQKQPALERCLYDMLRKGSGPSEILVHVFPVLRADSERFVVRLWRLVIYKTECMKIGVLRK